MSATSSSYADKLEQHSSTSSHSSTISTDGPPTPVQGSDGVSFQASLSTHTSIPETKKPFDYIGFREINYVNRLQLPTATTTTTTTTSKFMSPTSPTTHEPYTPSIYSPQTPAQAEAQPTFHLGWTDGDGDAGAEDQEEEEEEGLMVVVGPSDGEKQQPTFDPHRIPKPSFYELENPYGGTKHFMMAHGLRYYDQGDCEIRKEILEQLRDLEWQNRVNTAREEFVRTGKVSEGLLSEVAREYLREVEEVAT